MSTFNFKQYYGKNHSGNWSNIEQFKVNDKDTSGISFAADSTNNCNVYFKYENSGYRTMDFVHLYFTLNKYIFDPW